MRNHIEMDPRVIYHLSAQLVLQGEAMANAKRQYVESVNTQNDSGLENAGRGLFGVHGILTSAAMVSKILWGNEQREFLCTALGITEEHETILNNRDARNAVEHIDERIETYFANNPPADPNSVEALLAPRKVRDPRHHLGLVFEGSNVFTIVGNSVEFMKLPDAVADVAARARQWINDRRLPEYPAVLI